MINVNEMTMGEMFGEMVASRGVTGGSPTVDVVCVLVDTIRQANESVSEVATTILEDFLDGCVDEYLDVLTANVGEYVSNNTGEVVKVSLLPHLS